MTVRDFGGGPRANTQSSVHRDYESYAPQELQVDPNKTYVYSIQAWEDYVSGFRFVHQFLRNTESARFTKINKEKAKDFLPQELTEEQETAAREYIGLHGWRPFLGSMVVCGDNISAKARLLLAHGALNLVEAEGWQYEDMENFLNSEEVRFWAIINKVKRGPQFKRLLGFVTTVEELDELWALPAARDFMENPQKGNIYAGSNVATDAFIHRLTVEWLGLEDSITFVSSLRRERLTVLRYLARLNAK